MKYNLFIKTQSKTYNVLDIDETGLNRVLDAYKYGKGSFFLDGKKYWLNRLFEIQIYTFENQEFQTIKDFINLVNTKKLFEKGYLERNIWIPPKALAIAGKRITGELIQNDYGFLKDSRIEQGTNETFVDPSRIDELENIQNGSFDFTRLIALLKEMNVAYSHGLFLTIPLLVRSVIDHIPPVFSKTNFADVSGSYGTQSFKDSMNNLNKSSRKIADSFLHTQIRNKESLPTKTQINFKHDLDVLLQEIVRTNKK